MSQAEEIKKSQLMELLDQLIKDRDDYECRLELTHYSVLDVLQSLRVACEKLEDFAANDSGDSLHAAQARAVLEDVSHRMGVGLERAWT